MSKEQVGNTLGNPQLNQLDHEGIVGHYNASAGTPSNPEKLEAALKTHSATTYICGASYQCMTTGDQVSLGNQGHVMIVGRAVFSDGEINELATHKGPATALAEAYRRSHLKFTSGISGAFCFCIVDPEHDSVTLGVDRMGRYQLYYSQTPDGLSWGTTASAALESGGLDQELLAQGIFNYVYFHMVPSPGSIFSGLNKLPAAHILRYESGTCTPQRHWQPKFLEKSQFTFQEMGVELKKYLRNAVERAIGGEKAIGAFLSGGLDSSTVTGMLAELSDRKASAFSIGFAAEGYDEMEYARITAKHFGVQLNEYYVTPADVVDALPLIATSYDEPFGNSSALPAYFCARMAAENGVKVLLAGDGGDEIFAGNARYSRQRVFEHYLSIPSAIRHGLIEPILKLLPDSIPMTGKVKSYVTQANTPLPDRLQSYNFLHRHSAEEVFSSDFLAEVSLNAPLDLQRSVYNAPDEAISLNRMLYLDWQFTLADNDLRKVNQMCSIAGVEVTYPLLDDQLVAFSCEIPSAWKIKDGDLRHFFKEALKDWLPAETISKRKQGFGLPFGVWMKTYKPLQEMAYDNLLNLKGRNLINPDFIDRTIELHRSGHAPYYGELVWILTVFEMWMQCHSVRDTQK